MTLKGQKVLVTGADGFIGSHLVEALLECGAEPRAFCYYNSFNSRGWIDTFEKSKLSQIEVFMGDIRDSYGTKEALKSIDTVFHLAALIGIPYSYFAPDNYVDTNVKGTSNVLQAARELKTKNIIVTSTSEVYGTAQYVPIDELHPLNAQSPYAATKIAADQLALSFYRSFDLPVKIARPFNTYGPRQSARAIIPTIITQMISGKKEISLGSLSPLRDFTYVKDTARGLMAIAESEQLIGEVTNIGMNSEISVGDLFYLIAETLGKDVHIKSEQQRIRPEKSEVNRLCCDNSKILKNTNWKPQYDLNKGLTETIRWMEGNPDIYKAEVYNV